MIEVSDSATLDTLKARSKDLPAEDARWLATDKHVNTFMHFLAAGKPLFLAWLFNEPFADQMRTIRNLEGETALDQLQGALDKTRTVM